MAKNISKKFSFIGENIRRIRQAKNISQAEFAAFFHLGRAAVGAYEEGRSEPKIETIILIAKHFSISIDDLLTKQLTVSEIYSMDRVNRKLDQVHDRKEMQPGTIGIPLIKQNQFLDYVIRHKDASFIRSLDTIPIPIPLKEARVFEMKGYDMENHGQGIKPNDLLFCEKVDHKKSKALMGQVVVVITQDEVFCKRMTSISKDQIVFSSDALGVIDLTKHIGEISEMWQVLGVFSTKLSEPSKLEDRMSQLEEMIMKMKK